MKRWYAVLILGVVVLASSGLLVKEIGGPSLKPYQPKGIWESSTSGRGVLAYYVQDHGEKLYRRGVYNFIKRTVPPPVISKIKGRKLSTYFWVRHSSTWRGRPKSEG